MQKAGLSRLAIPIRLGIIRADGLESAHRSAHFRSAGQATGNRDAQPR